MSEREVRFRVCLAAGAAAAALALAAAALFAGATP